MPARASCHRAQERSSRRCQPIRVYAAAVERLGLRPVPLLIHDLDGGRDESFEVRTDVAQQTVFERDLKGSA